MNTWVQLILFCYFCLLPSFASAEVTERKKAELERLVHSGKIRDASGTEEQYYAKWISELNTEERAALVPIVRELRDKIPNNQERDKQQWNGLLAHLGDEEALKINIENWRQFGYDLEVMFAESGQLPLYLETELFTEAVHDGFGDTNSIGKFFGAAESILYYLKHNQYYPRDVREWAGRTLESRANRGDPTPMRRVVRGWYRCNEGFIRTKQYGRVKPGEELPPQPGAMKFTGPPPVPPLPLLEDRPYQPPHTPKPVSTPIVASPSPISEPESKPSGNYALFAAVAAFVAASFLFLRNRLTRKK